MEMEKILDTAHGRFLLRPYRDEDEDKVIALWEMAFKQKMNRRIWRWKYHNNPFGRQMMLCLNESGQPVTMYSGIPFSANWNGQEIRMTQLIDNMSHPAYRFSVKGRMGLYGLTVEHFVDAYGWPNESVISYGFAGIRHYKLGTMFFDYEKIAGGGIYLQANINKLKSKPIFSFRKTEKIDSKQFQNGLFDNIQQQLTPQYPFAVLRNDKFIRWRFFAHPSNKYHVYSGKTFTGTPISYITLRVDDNDVTIVDIYAPAGKNEASRLLHAALSEMKTPKPEIVRTWLPVGHFLSHELLGMGFSELAEPLGIIPAVRRHCKDITFDFVDRNIFYTMADGDLF